MTAPSPMRSTTKAGALTHTRYAPRTRRPARTRRLLRSRRGRQRLEHIDNPTGTLAVPQRRYGPGDAVRLEPLPGRGYSFGIGADDTIRPVGDRYRPLRVLAKGQTWHPKDGRF